VNILAATAVPVPTSGVDLRVALATALHAAPGVYAALIGSGVSSAAGVPTGWQVVEDLIRTIAIAEGADEEAVTADPEAWWLAQGRSAPRYDSLISALAATDPARQVLLRGYFDPAPAQGGPILPTPAHRALAQLAASGRIRLIITTNFDRLIERALDEVGISAQVIASASAVAGMTPLAHAPMTVVKLHGDYATPGLRNTSEELADYPPEWKALLGRVFDEYGLLVIGWSGQYDVGLVTALEASATRRYPTFWASFGGELTESARRLIAQRQASVIDTAGADEFLGDVVERLRRLDQVAARRGRPTPLRTYSFMPQSGSAPQEWATLPLLQLRVAALFGPASVDTCGIIRPPNREAVLATMQAAPVTARIRKLGLLPPATAAAEPTPPGAIVSSEPLVDWQPAPGGHQSTEYACYRLGGDAGKGVSALVSLRFPGFGVGEAVLFTIDVAVSSTSCLGLADVAALLRDALVACTADLPDALAEIMPSDAEVTQAELHLLAATTDGQSKNRANDLALRVDLAPLGDSSRPVGQSLGFAARLSAPLTDREAAELVLEGIEYMALASGYLDPTLGLSTLRRDLGLESSSPDPLAHHAVDIPSA
jgi:hypothetical protein